MIKFLWQINVENDTRKTRSRNEKNSKVWNVHCLVELYGSYLHWLHSDRHDIRDGLLVALLL